MESESTRSDSAPTTYQPPPWSAPPKHDGFLVEVVKSGQVTEKISLREKPFFVFGRLLDADVVVEHPSLSRHHCAIQFSKEAESAFLCDLGSTHGTFLNKAKLTPREYQPLTDGDVLTLGFSSRLYVFNTGYREPESIPRDVPIEPKKHGVKRAKRLVTWGLQEDATPEVDVTDIDWRSYSESHQLTQKQEKMIEKIRKLERRKEKLEMESKRIHEKEAQYEELNPGQITALLSNDRALEELNEELEEAEDAIQTSILEKLHPSKAKARAEAKVDAEFSDSDDAFYDRSKKPKSNAEDTVLSAESLLKEREKLEERLAALKAQTDAPEQPQVDTEAESDALEVFMSAMVADQELQEKQARSTEMQSILNRLEEIKKLLKFIDPDAFFPRNEKSSHTNTR